ncbi:PDR/VanB family oxidoreductase [Mesorhizobium sp. 1B3]|uniref:PDR/VanB family oxidoreductase n=1 Tax=Mesorhizobium sp. 1B3 TaxID=3243599 RepID=UPI003D97D264
MPKLIHRVTVKIVGMEAVCDDVVAIELADPDGWKLPPFTAGSHIDVHLPNGMVRQYSLIGDPAEADRYRIAVRREDGGRGGSLCLHRHAGVGTILPVSLPRNCFGLAAARRHVMIAGGIGITPFLSMIPEIERAGADLELHFCSRTRADTPFLRQLQPLAVSGRLIHYFSREREPHRIDLAAVLSAAAPDAHVYCCGPSSLIHAAQAIAGTLLPEGRLHVEHFGPTVTTTGAAYSLELAKTGRRIEVLEGMTMLDALRRAGVDMPASCEAGVCLDCRIRFLDGEPIHRDLVMKPAERRQFLTPCVSGCSSATLVLDL